MSLLCGLRCFRGKFRPFFVPELQLGGEKHRAKTKRRRARLHLEALEDRTLFSVNLLSSIKGMDTNTAGGVVEPPDTIAAAGPNTVIEEINSNIAIYDKATGKQLATLDLGTFFSSVDTAQSLFSDVNVTYDEQAGRFFVSTMDIDFGTNAAGTLASYFDFAISNTSNPADLTTASWTDIHQIKTDEVSPRTGEQLFTDFPRLGWNADAYVVAFNMFGFNSMYQYNVQLVTIDKASVLDKNAATLTTYRVDRPLPNSTMVPAVMHGSSPGDPMWFVEEKGLEQDGTNADLRVVQMTNVLSASPTFTDYYVPMDAYTITPFPQDTAGTVSNVLDTRILNVDWRNNQMVVAQNVGITSDTNVHARWYEISTAGAAPSMVQQGTLNPGPGIDTYMPSVALAPDGTIGMTYIESAAGVEDMSMYVTGRAPTDPLGTMQTGVKVSPAPVTGQMYNYGGSRIGDFSGITVDPSDPTKFWAANEYAIVADPLLLTFPNWGTYIGQFDVDTTPGAPTPPRTGGVPSNPGAKNGVAPPRNDNLGRTRGHLLLQHPPVAPHRGHRGNGPSGGPSPLLVSKNVNFPGLNTNDAGGVVEPPDTIAAAGPTAVVEEVNSNIAYYDKTTGKQLFSEGLDVFFAPVDTLDFLFSDVNVTYDEQAGRFFVSTMDINMDPTTGPLASYFDFAISNDSNPLDGFTEMHQINTTEVSPQTGESLFTDFPRLGWNADAYVVAFNMFGFLSEYQYNVQLLTIDKSSVLDKNSATLTYHQVDRPLPNSTMVPAVMHGSAPGDPMWFVEEKGLEQDGSYADLRMVKMTNVLSATPTFTDYYVPLGAYTITPFPEDTLGQVSFVLDTRVLNIDWRNNEMVVSQNVGIGIDTNVHARWYEISTAGTSPSLVQEGEVNPGPGIDTYMPSVAITADGTIGMTYIESAAPAGTFLGENMSMYVTGRAASDPLGTMQAPVLAKAGELNYQGTRIGDYSGITVDPSVGGTFWAANEYAISTTNIALPNWGTWIASFTVTPLGVTPGSVSGQVFNDLNGDGINESEPGFNGVTIELFDSGNKLVGSTVTATGSDGKDGEYSFTNLTPGNYTVMEIVPTGWTATTTTSAPAVVTSGTNTGGVNFGDFQLVTLSGTIFNDLNGDGAQESGEPGLQNWAADLLKGTTLVKQILTDASGNFSFANLGPGTYTVQEEQEPGWLLTSKPAAYTVTTTSGMNVGGNVFGNFQTIRISGTIFDDLNQDGIQEAGEPGLQGWTVDLVHGQSTAKRTTDSNGNFTFGSVGPGTFTIQEEVQTGWVQTSTPLTYSVTTTSGTDITGKNFGNITPATHFAISAPAITTAGAALSFTVTALDAFNNTAAYAGTVTFSSTDPKSALPANYKFTSADAGVHTFSAILRKAGSQTITAKDTVTTSITGTSSAITVSPGPTHHLVLSYFPSPITAGVVAQNFRVTAQDLYGNTETGFTDTVGFTSSDGQAVLPANYTFTSTDAGVHTFSATLKTAGIQSVTVKDVTNTSVFSGTRSGIKVLPAATSQFLLTGYPPTVKAGTANSMTVTAADPFGNTTPGYQGTVHFTSSDLSAPLPPNYTFASSDAGVHKFMVVLVTPGTQSVSVTDTAKSSITGTMSGITVVLAQPTAGISGPSAGVPGQPLTYTFTATESGLAATTVYSYSVNWGDGSAVQTVSGASGTRTTHAYTIPGSYPISLTATDPSGNASVPVTMSITTTTVLMEPDPYDPSQTALYFGGTTGNDTIAITPVAGGGVKVGMNFFNYGSFFPTGHVVVYGQSGNDIIKTAAQMINGVLTYVSVPALFFAGNGNDILNATGSIANNVLVGGSGADRLLGGQGRDILIGGSGPSTLNAGSGGDILIGGTTSFDDNAAALAAILVEWGSTDDYATRIARIMGTMSGGLNGTFFLNTTTVQSNGQVNKLYGGPGMDWYFAGIMDMIFNKTAGEVVTMV